MTGILADRLQLWGFEDDLAVFEDGSLGFGLRVGGVDVLAYSDSDLGNFSEKISRLLNGLPEAIDIQFLLEVTNKNESIISTFREFSKVTKQKVAGDLTQARAAQFELESQSGLLPRYELTVFVRKAPSAEVFKKFSFFKSQKHFLKKTEEQFQIEVAGACAAKEEVKHALSVAGLSVEGLSAAELFKKTYQQWNPLRDYPTDNDFKYDPYHVREHLLFTDAMVYENGFALGSTHYRVLSLKLHPHEVESGMAMEFLKLPQGVKLFLTIRNLEQQKEIANLQAKRKTAYSMTHGKVGARDIESESKLQDVENILTELLSQKERIFEVSFNILLHHEDESRLDQMVRDSLFVIRALNGAEGMTESLAAFDIFTEFSVPNSSARERAKFMKTSFAAEFLPVVAPWEGHAIPKSLFKTCYGTILKFDPMDVSLSNFNQIISGSSGAGKSFVANLFLLQMIKFAPRVFIIDIGGSYRKMCEVAGGEYINFSLSAGHSLNPFDLPEGVLAPDSIKIKFLLGMLEIMTKEESAVRLGKLEQAEIEDAIRQVYERPAHEWRISTLRQILLVHQDENIKRLGKVLAPWVGNTPYGSFLDHPTTIKLSSEMICFDLKGLEGFPDLQAVSLFTITNFIWPEIQKNPSQMKFIALDECWKLLDYEIGSTLVGELYRTARKYLTSVIAISQNIDDFAKSKVATAILANASIKWILSQKGADQARLADVLQLNPNELAIVKSLAQAKGKYSESFLMAGDERSLVSIEPLPLEYWIATSDPRDLTVLDIERITYPELGLLGLLTNLSQKYPRGVVGSQGVA